MRIRKGRRAGSMSGAWRDPARCSERTPTLSRAPTTSPRRAIGKRPTSSTGWSRGELPPDVDARLARMRERLLGRRATRVRPGLDDKVLADWNGLMIAALVRAALLLEHPDWIALAERAYRFIAGIDEPGRAPRSFLAGGRADLSGLRPRSCRHDAGGAGLYEADRRATATSTTRSAGATCSMRDYIVARNRHFSP